LEESQSLVVIEKCKRWWERGKTIVYKYLDKCGYQGTLYGNSKLLGNKRGGQSDENKDLNGKVSQLSLNLKY
jgi:hypothetical protein